MNFLLPASVLAHCQAGLSAGGLSPASCSANVSPIVFTALVRRCQRASERSCAHRFSRSHPHNACNTSRMLAWIPSPSPCCSTQWQAPDCQIMTQDSLLLSPKFINSRGSPHALLFMWCCSVLRSTLLSLPSLPNVRLCVPPTTVLISRPLVIL